MVINEKVEITLGYPPKTKSWEKKLGYKPEVNKPFFVDWFLLKTTSFRRKKIKIKCDDCEIIYEKRICGINGNVDYCVSCMNKGSRNGMYGSKPTENFIKARDKMLKEFGNPFTWESTKQNNIDKEVWKKIGDKNKGKKRTEETKKKLSKSIKNAYKYGRLKPQNRWGKTIVKQYNGIDYQSTYELNFIKYCEEIGLFELLERGPIIQYVDDNGLPHNYFSDFKIKDTDIVIEIKSTYIWKKNQRINEIKKEFSEKLYNYLIIKDNNFSEFNNLITQKVKNIVLH
jgi:hypothetical protein